MMQILIDAVKTYADEHYGQDGWDIVSECYSDAEIADLVQGSATAADAIAAVLTHIRPIAEYRDDIQAEAY
jgi:hypothetical protein